MRKRIEGLRRVSEVPVQAAPPGRRRLVRVGWIAAGLAGALVFGLAVAQLTRTGTRPEELAKAFGFTIGDFRARSERQSRPAPAIAGEGLDGGRIADRKSVV